MRLPPVVKPGLDDAALGDWDGKPSGASLPTTFHWLLAMGPIIDGVADDLSADLEAQPPRALELIATEWLEAERRLVSHLTEAAEAGARDLGLEYEAAIRSASQEDLRLAWEAARVAQARCEVGSAEWAEARSVSELLRMEYAAIAKP